MEQTKSFGEKIQEIETNLAKALSNLHTGGYCSINKCINALEGLYHLGGKDTKKYIIEQLKRFNPN